MAGSANASLFPSLDAPEAWSSVRLNDAALRPGVAAICARHGLAGEELTRYPTGSVPVYAVGARHALKLFPPEEQRFARTEARSLGALEGRLPIPTPALIAADALDGWHYVLMSRLHGTLLSEVWATLPDADRDRAVTELGACLAALHAIDPPALDDTDWNAWIAAQRASATERQRARRLDERWCSQIDAFLDAEMPPPVARKSLLHTEVMREHLLVARGPRGWQLTGLFDFEPARVGAPEYEFASFGVFVSCGDGALLRRASRAYGLAESSLDAALSRRFMAYALLHQYSNLRWYMERLPLPPDVTTLDALATRWWSFDSR